MRYLPGVHIYFSDITNHKHINDTLKTTFALRHEGSFMIDISTNPASVILYLSLVDEDYALVCLNYQDQINTISLTSEFFDKYCTAFQHILRIDSLDTILKDL